MAVLWLELTLFGLIPLLLVACGLAAFMLNRIYVGLRDRELNVRGWVYSREETPAKYWLTIVMAGLGLLFGLLMLVVAIGGLASALR